MLVGCGKTGADTVCFPKSVACLHLQDAISNSNGCLSTIQKCEPGACATRNVMGTARWVCLRCLANYEPVVDASGQDNIIQCGECPAVYTLLSGKLHQQQAISSTVQWAASMPSFLAAVRLATLHCVKHFSEPSLSPCYRCLTAACVCLPAFPPSSVPQGLL